MAEWYSQDQMIRFTRRSPAILPFGSRLSAIVITALWPAIGRAQTPGDAVAPAPTAAIAAPPAPAATPPCERRGAIHRLFHHTAHTAEDKFIGYPATFVEPPLGVFAAEQFAVQVGKADWHRFMLYNTDFLPGTNVLSPVGASRFNIMVKRACAWPGPITIEWTPDQPTVAEARRLAVAAMLKQAGQPIVAERVVIGPSPYPGGIGLEPANFYHNMTIRSQMASPTFALPPIESASSGVR